MHEQLAPTGPLLESPPRAGVGRFTYGSGDRPLEGYTIKRGIGRGGFGEVYYATSDGGKEVAIKLVQRNLEVELRGVGQCLNLKHPNLVALYDVKQAAGGGDYWVVMEYVAGESLAELMDRHPQGLPAEEARRWIGGICAAIGYLHDRGIVHRDLKPANIFMEEGVVKVGDYGLSKFITASRRSGQTESVGTVHYMAPEIANGRYGKEIDIYAAGIILYEMLTGKVPFEGESVGEILMKHLTAEPDVSVLSEPYRQVVARALAKDPGKRCGAIQEMAAELEGRVAEAGGAPALTFGSPTTPAHEQPIALTEADLVHDAAQAAGARHAGPVAGRGGIWAEFVREDPIVGWLRRLFQQASPNNLWHVLGIALAGLVILMSGLIAFVAMFAAVYVPVALLLRWLKRPAASSVAAVPAERAVSAVLPARAGEGGAPRSCAPASLEDPVKEVALGRAQSEQAAASVLARRALRSRARQNALRMFIVLMAIAALFVVMMTRRFGRPGVFVLAPLPFATVVFGLISMAYYGLACWWGGRRIGPGFVSEAAPGMASESVGGRRKAAELAGSMFMTVPVVLLLCAVLGTLFHLPGAGRGDFAIGRVRVREWAGTDTLGSFDRCAGGACSKSPASLLSVMKGGERLQQEYLCPAHMRQHVWIGTMEKWTFRVVGLQSGSEEAAASGGAFYDPLHFETEGTSEQCGGKACYRSPERILTLRIGPGEFQQKYLCVAHAESELWLVKGPYSMVELASGKLVHDSLLAPRSPEATDRPPEAAAKPAKGEVSPAKP